MLTDWLKSINGLLIDITGVLYESGDIPRPIEQSADALKLLDALDIKYILCTNETVKTTADLAAKLNRLGYDISKEKIVAPAPCVVAYLAEHNLRPWLIVHSGLYY